MLDSRGFDLWADGYDRAVGLSAEDGTYPFAGYRAVLGQIYKIVMAKPGARVLDLGFGTGTLTSRLYENGCGIYGQDFSERMTALAQRKMPKARLFTEDLTQGLAEPLARGTYDFIIATYSLHHLTDEQKIPFLEALRFNLAPGGRVLIGDVAFADRSALENCRRAAGEDWDGDEHYFVYDELKEKLPGLTFTPVSFCAGILSL